MQVYAPIINAEEAEVEWFYEDLQDLLELTSWKDVLFIIGDWNAKVGSQETPGVTGKFGLGVQNEAGQRLTVLPRESTGHSKHSLPTTQEKILHMDVTRWSIVKSLSHVRLFVTPWTVAHQVPWSMGFSRHEYWSGLPFPSPGDLPDPGIEPRSPTLQADAL